MPQPSASCVPTPSLHPLLKSLCQAMPLAVALLPVAASAAGTVSAAGTYDGYGVDGSTAVSATNAPFYVQNASVDPNAPYAPYARQSAASDGLGNFAGQVQAGVSPAQPYKGITAYSSLSLIDSDTLVNTGRRAQDVVFNFNIFQVLFNLGAPLDAGYNSMDLGVQASFAARIYVNGASTATWSSSFSLSAKDPQHWTVTSSGTDLGLSSAYANAVAAEATPGRLPGAYLQSDPYHGSLALGALGSGESLSVRYEVDLLTEAMGYGGSAAVTFADPAGLSEGDVDALSSASLGFATAVPEASTLEMSAAGLAVLGAALRRRKGAKPRD